MDKEILLSGIAKALEIDRSQIDESYPIAENNPWDSLVTIMVIGLVDEHCDVVLDGELMGKCATIADLFQLIEKTGG